MGLVDFIFFSYSHQRLLLKWNMNEMITMVFYLNIFYNVVYFCDGKAEFSAAITPVFSVTWSFRNHSKMLICCFQGWKQLCFLIHTFSMVLWQTWGSKEQHVFKIEIFTVTFVKLNVYFLNTFVFSFILTPSIWTVVYIYINILYIYFLNKKIAKPKITIWSQQAFLKRLLFSIHTHSDNSLNVFVTPKM